MTWRPNSTSAPPLCRGMARVCGSKRLSPFWSEGTFLPSIPRLRVCAITCFTKVSFQKLNGSEFEELFGSYLCLWASTPRVAQRDRESKEKGTATRIEAALHSLVSKVSQASRDDPEARKEGMERGLRPSKTE